ncbi:c-type cytochrome [Thalassolituus sp.]|uniref:c-type cytochrome n=3 Tax=Thalassolituus sp. TaxID=2030822 RepID=UPI00351282BA
MKRIIYLVLVVSSSFILAACKNSYEGELSGSTVTDDIQLEDGTLINIAGQQAYNEQCANCHAPDGNGTSAGTSLIGCATCGDLAELSALIERTMPIGNPASCSGTCASDTAEYIFYAFNVQDIEEADVTSMDIQLEDAGVTLRRASLQLSGALPTATALAASEVSEEALSAALDGVLSTDTFYEILLEIFNKKFLTDKYLTAISGRGHMLEYIDEADFPNKLWFEGYASTSVEKCAIDATNDAIAREPLELVRYIAMNDLPVTELVTSSYTMVNWYSLQTYGAELVNPSDSFRELDSPVCADGEEGLHYDPMHFLPARVSGDLEHESAGVPHSGVLTMPVFLNRYPTTVTNLNRHRARTVYDYFLDTDIMAITGGSRSNADGIGEGDIPTMTDPSCIVCHSVMDPVSSLFQNWTATGRYIRANKVDVNEWDGETIFPPGFNGDVYPGYAAEQVAPAGMIQWLGQSIVGDSRYPRAIVKILYEGLFGQELLLSPSDRSSDSDKEAFNIQRRWINELSASLVDSGWNLKVVMKGMLMSPYYRAQSVDGSDSAIAEYLGVSHRLSPRELQRKLIATVGFSWDELWVTDSQLMYGGINSDDVTEELREPSGLADAMHRRMAVEMGCRATSYDFALDRSERILFKGLDHTLLPFDSITGEDIPESVNAIKEAIVTLHWRLYGVEYDVTSDVVGEVYELYRRVLEHYREANPGRFLSCRATKKYNVDGSQGEFLPEEQWLEHDASYSVQAWTAVMVYLLSDFRFIYE